jgi:hypothetical protein
MSSFLTSFSTAPYAYPPAKFVPYRPLQTKSRATTAKRKAKSEAIEHKPSDEKSIQNGRGVEDISILSGPTSRVPYFSNEESPALLGAREPSFPLNNEGTVDWCILEYVESQLT